MKSLLRRLVLLSALFAVSSCANGCGILKRVDELQATARAANSGSLGCGEGSAILVTSKGEAKVSCSLDPIHVFGERINVSDIHVLLRSRADSNRTGKKGPMSGEVSALCYVCLSTLSLAKDPDSIPVITSLLEDRDDVVRGWAAIALFRIAETDKELKKQIEKIEFPAPARASARSRGNPPPSWVTKNK